MFFGGNMSKFVLDIVYDEKNNAGSKAKSDVTEIVTHELGYQSIQACEFLSVKDKLNGLGVVRRILSEVSAGDTILVQYPTYFGHFWESKLFRAFKKKQIKIVILLHDVDVLRVENLPKFKNIHWVTALLNFADVLISPNQSMTRLLMTNGLSIPVINLNIYDYLQSGYRGVRESRQRLGLSFAGNLNKSSFLHFVPASDTYDLFLFGMLDGDNKFNQANVYYQGVFPPDELKNELPSGFGLVWDGQSVDRLAGKMGEYLQYNNPHKTSLYLSSGLPVIVPEKSAISSFVVDNQVGLTVDSLINLPDVIKHITVDDYELLQNNVNRIGKSLRSGFYTKQAVKHAEQIIK